MIRGLASPELNRIYADPNLNPIPDRKNPFKGEAVGGPGGSVGELQKVARQFESILLDMVLKSMRNTVPKSDLFDGGNAEQIWTGLLDQNLSAVAATHGHGFGLADKIVKQYAKHVKG